MIESGHLPEACRIHLKLSKMTGTDTYCWHQEEVQAILDRCRVVPELGWLGNVLTALSCTGMRISELASLRFTDFGTNVIKLTDETAMAVRSTGLQVRQLNSRRSRSFPIHADLLPVLNRIERHSDGRVFHGPLGGVIKPDIVAGAIKILTPLTKKFRTPEGEIGFKDGRLHSFRPYFCSVCANTGVPEQVVIQWLGHRDSQMVRHYYHLHDEEAQRQMQKVNFVGSCPAKVAADGTTEVS